MGSQQDAAPSKASSAGPGPHPQMHTESGQTCSLGHAGAGRGCTGQEGKAHLGFTPTVCHTQVLPPNPAYPWGCGMEGHCEPCPKALSKVCLQTTSPPRSPEGLALTQQWHPHTQSSGGLAGSTGVSPKATGSGAGPPPHSDSSFPKPPHPRLTPALSAEPSPQCQEGLGWGSRIPTPSLGTLAGSTGASG